MSSSLNPFASLRPAQLNYAQSEQWKTALKQAVTDLRVSIPAIVQSVDYTKNPPVVAVQIAITEVVQTPEGPQNTAIWPIFNVPLVVFSMGGFSITFPPKEGDEGLLVFCDMCIDAWWQNGGVQNQIERRRHDLTDCGFIPGLRSQARPIPDWSQNSLQIRSDDGSTYVEIAAGQIVNIVAPGGINLKGNVNVTGTIVASEEITGNGIALSTHKHSGVQTGSGDTGPPVP